MAIKHHPPGASARCAAVGLFLLLAGCATAPHPFRTVSEIDEQIMRSLRELPDDPETMARLSPANLVREGRTLTVRTSRRTFRFTEAGFCEGYNSCARFRADQQFFGRFVGIRMMHGEYPDSYFIIDLTRGARPFDTGVRPFAAPQPPFAALADDGEINEPIIGGLAVVDLRNRRIAWHEPKWYRDSRIEGWEGPRCVRASYRPGMLGEDNRLRTVWIAEQAGQWAAHDARPDACTPA